MAGNDSFTKLLLHCNGADSAQVFTDDSLASPTHVITAVDNAHTDTTVKKFGTASAQLDGAGDELTAPDHDDWTPAADYTVDFWARFNDLGALPVVLIAHSQSTTKQWTIYQTATDVGFTVAGGPTIAVTGAFVPVVDTWYHYAWIREGNTHRITVDGAVKITNVNAGAFFDVAGSLRVGDDAWPAGDMKGYIDEIRISKGVARWTAFPFAVPTEAYSVMPRPNVSDRTIVFPGRKRPPKRKTGLTGLYPSWRARVPTWVGSDANVTATRLRVDSYGITWDAVRYTTFGGIEVEYEVSLNKDGAGYVAQAIMPADATSFNVCDLESGSYVARVRARYHKLTTQWYEASYNSTAAFDLTAAFTWPATLPQTVSQPRYAESMVDIVERSEMDTGPAKVRRRHRTGVERFSSSMQLTTAQVVTLEEFFEVSVQGGAVEFAWTHPRTGATVKMRFVKPPVLKQIGPAHWDASLALEILP